MKELADTGWSRWFEPAKRGYLEACCGCGLVHRVQHRYLNGRIVKRAQVAPRITAQHRKRTSKDPHHG